MSVYRTKSTCESCGVTIPAEKRAPTTVGTKGYDLCPDCRRALILYIDERLNDYTSEEEDT